MKPALCVTLSAAAIVALPSTAVAETHRFTPTVYYPTYSFAHPPALRIKPGDRVITRTIDAGGSDESGKQVASIGPNPEIGPFYIEGAEPGDALVVTFERIETNRQTAFSGSALAPYTADPQSLLQRQPGQAPRVNWMIDRERGIARLEHPDLLPTVMELPLLPMLGCVGVAPARKEAILSTVPGPWGGNMDYKGLNSGVKVTLPVNEPGALLFMGDGHARQGDGEVVGLGMETSMDVEFTVELVKNKAIGWPRLENNDYIMVLASARPLLEAFQHATTEMQRVLVADYGFNERGAAAFMGQAVEYEIANVVDPSFTIVAKVRKSFLRR
jgi:acetamidase/formamidase